MRTKPSKARLYMTAPDLARIEDHARRALPREACGLLLGTGSARTGFRVTRVIASRNVAPLDRVDRFEIDPVLLLKTQRALRGRSERMLGVYHSHPGGRPELSETDRANAWTPGLVWLITALDLNKPAETCAFHHAEGLAHGRFDPIELIATGSGCVA